MNFSKNAANIYVRQYSKEVFEVCIEKFKLKNSMTKEQEVFIKKVCKELKST